MNTKSEVRETIGDAIMWIVLSWITLGTVGAMFFAFASRHQNTVDIVGNYALGGMMFACCILLTYFIVDHTIDHTRWLREKQKKEEERQRKYDEMMVGMTDWGTEKAGDSSHKRAPVGRRTASWRRSRVW